jgi:predicted DCC family thiol-disulfide oxidoreductase YuxK
MKTEKIISRFCLAIVVFAFLLPGLRVSPQTVGQIRHYDHGLQISTSSPKMGFYPINRFAGIPLSELQQYTTFSTATLPASQDTNGNWGTAVDDLQLSLRFRDKQYSTNSPVPAIIILRNLSWTNRFLGWRNALPDHGYEFILRNGTNVIRWRRQQNPPPIIVDWNDGSINTDPYQSWASAHCEELTVVDLRQFFDLSHADSYSLQVQIQIPTSDGKGIANLFSGVATFQEH